MKKLLGTWQLQAVADSSAWASCSGHIPEGIDRGSTYTLKVWVFDQVYTFRGKTQTRKAIAVQVCDSTGVVATTSPVWIRRLFGINLGAGHNPNIEGGNCYVLET